MRNYKRFVVVTTYRHFRVRFSTDMEYSQKCFKKMKKILNLNNKFLLPMGEISQTSYYFLNNHIWGNEKLRFIRIFIQSDFYMQFSVN